MSKSMSMSKSKSESESESEREGSEDVCIIGPVTAAEECEGGHRDRECSLQVAKERARS